MKIALSTDHAGFEQLKLLKEFLESQGHICVDFGPPGYEETDDYPDYIKPVAKAIASGEAEVGIIMGSSGQGEAMVANRYKGVRCAVYYGPAHAIGVIDADGKLPKDEYEIIRLSRQHNHANALSLAARFLNKEDIEQAVSIWLETPFSELERHARRVQKIDEIN